LKEGREAGQKEGRREAAKKMKANGLPVSTIAVCTDLSAEEIEML
jgi:predicted transposase/invertase (TIGR01784 family)